MMRALGGFGIVVAGLAGVIIVNGCARSKESERQAVAKDLNRWLGHDKESLIVQIGPPAQCTTLPQGGGEVCEWRTPHGPLLYHYDTRGIARSWTYMDPAYDQMEGGQDPAERQASEGGVCRPVQEILHDMQYGPTAGGGGRQAQA